MYADKITDSMEYAIKETERRRNIQKKYNMENGIVPKTIIKEIRDSISNEDETVDKKTNKKDLKLSIDAIEKEMRKAARELDFEKAMELRDLLFELKVEDKK